jgi:hypothetical protein
MIMNLIDSERPPILCIEAAVRNGGRELLQRLGAYFLA